MDEDFLLENSVSQALYHDYARKMPIIDYHNHLPPKAIADDQMFSNLTQVWLNGDHYKWRAMRALGIDEKYITGPADDQDKFTQWARAVPYTMRNPLYHWTHLELKRYFGIDRLLGPDTAEEIFLETRQQLQQAEYSTQGLLQKMNVEYLCTTDDPTDDLTHHKKFARQDASFRMFPTFRPDKAILIRDKNFSNYIQRLEETSGQNIQRFEHLIEVLISRMELFHQQGCRLADHGLNKLNIATCTFAEVGAIFTKRMEGQELSPEEEAKYQTALLLELGRAYHQRGWTMQLHLGARRNNRSRMKQLLGPDTGFDSIDDQGQAAGIAGFLDLLDATDQLPQTILYNLNPSDNEVFAAMAGNFNDASSRTKVQYGAAWWFLDQKDGMEKQLNTLSNLGLLSCFIGMLTDSRSFLSFPRHEYFRRILCNLIGKDVEKGELPCDIPWLGKIVSDICYYNAHHFLKLEHSINE